MESDSFDQLARELADRYRVDREIGRGGMASVYLAEDLRHDRQVAIKVLLPELSARIGRDRFLAEIKTTAQLQHPHLLPLLDSGESAGMLYFVMPYVAGPSLADRLQREGQLPIPEAVRITKSVASALGFAHRSGVVHRDVKPSNILLHDGQAMVTDFGIARAVTTGGLERMTETGLALGTPHYMSPEQLTDDMEAGPSSDVYAMGCVLYEMLAGRPPFEASTITGLAGRVLTARPSRPSRERPTIPPHVEGAVMKALEKIPADRFASPAEFAEALDDEAFRHGLPHAEGGRAEVGGSPGWHVQPTSRLALAVIALLSVALAAVLLTDPTTPSNPAPPTSITLDGTAWRELNVLSDDGRLAAGRPDPEGPIRITRLDGGASTELDVESDVQAIAFSPDGQWLLIGGTGGLRRVPVQGGRPVLVAEHYTTAADWSRDGTVAFVGLDGIYTVPWDGGGPTRVRDGGYLTVGRLDFLPDGRHLLLTRTALGESPGSEILLLDVETGTVERVIEDGVAGEFLPPDLLLFVRPERGLFATVFDADSRATRGPAVPVLDSVVANSVGAGYAVSESGTVVALVGPSPPDTRDGAALAFADTLGQVDTLPIRSAAPSASRLSPDGSWIALQTPHGEAIIIDRATGASSALPHAGLFFSAAWHPSSDTVTALVPTSEGEVSLVAFPIDGSGDSRVLLELPANEFFFPLSWSPDGDLILIQSATGGGQDFNLEILEARTGQRRPYLAAEWAESLGSISPDGRWVAYTSGETSRLALRSFPTPGASYDISRVDLPMDRFVSQPRWAPDGSGVYWQDREGVMFTPLTVEPSVEVGEPRRVAFGAYLPFFDVGPDGRLLLALPNTPVDAPDRGDLRTLLLVNWLDRLREAVTPPR